MLHLISFWQSQNLTGGFAIQIKLLILKVFIEDICCGSEEGWGAATPASNMDFKGTF